MHHHPDSQSRITLCVGAVVLREEKVLFVRQTYCKLKGKWSLPWGFVDGIGPDGFPESPDEAAIRETQEEAGITARAAGLLGIQNRRTGEGKQSLYILLWQFHGINSFERPGEVLQPGGALEEVQQARRIGKIRHIGFSSHSLRVALEAVASGRFETVQFPLNFISAEAASGVLPTIWFSHHTL